MLDSYFIPATSTELECKVSGIKHRVSDQRNSLSRRTMEPVDCLNHGRTQVSSQRKIFMSLTAP